MRRPVVFLPLLLALALAACTMLERRATGQSQGDQPREIMEMAAATVRQLRAGPQGARFAEALSRCRAALVFPDQFKIGIIIAGGGGPGVLMARQADGSFGEPAFFTLSQAGWGAQAGVRRTKLALLFLSDNATRQVLAGDLDVGGEGGLTVATLDASYAATTATLTPDVVAASVSDGLFGGVALDGLALHVQDSYNIQYHRKTLTPADILALPPQPDPAADDLRRALEGK
jgi:lipid-binding SYLF domain-containing protein